MSALTIPNPDAPPWEVVVKRQTAMFLGTWFYLQRVVDGKTEATGWITEAEAIQWAADAGLKVVEP